MKYIIDLTSSMLSTSIMSNNVSIKRKQLSAYGSAIRFGQFTRNQPTTRLTQPVTATISHNLTQRHQNCWGQLPRYTIRSLHATIVRRAN